MKRIKYLILAITVVLSGCSIVYEPVSETMPGVVIENDEVYSVTFELPEGESIEEVLGSELGSEHQMAITFGNDTSISYWYVVENGGLLSRYGNYYRYGPTAEIVECYDVVFHLLAERCLVGRMLNQCEFFSGNLERSRQNSNDDIL